MLESFTAPKDFRALMKMDLSEWFLKIAPHPAFAMIVVLL